jgi:hypothetical protein
VRTNQQLQSVVCQEGTSHVRTERQTHTALRRGTTGGRLRIGPQQLGKTNGRETKSRVSTSYKNRR